MPPTDALTDADVYVFRAALVGFRGVSRKLAVRTDQILMDVHRFMQAAFGWDDDHLYAFWLSGKFWDREPGPGFGRPDFCRDSGDRSARVKLSRLGLDVGQGIAYVFDFGEADPELTELAGHLRRAEAGRSGASVQILLDVVVNLRRLFPRHGVDDVIDWFPAPGSALVDRLRPCHRRRTPSALDASRSSWRIAATPRDNGHAGRSGHAGSEPAHHPARLRR